MATLSRCAVPGSSIGVTDVVGVEEARRQVRAFCVGQGLERNRAEELVIAVSELATNLMRYARGGQISWRRVRSPRAAIEVVCRDEGPGIIDLTEAMKDGFSTGGGLGGGLPAIERLVDDFNIESSPAATVICIRKFL